MIMAYLSEASDVQEINGVKAVRKYQRADLLYREILGLYAELDKSTVYRKTDGASAVYLFTGASGGVGTTSLAVASAVRLASYGKKVLYINLEENGILSPFLEGEGNGTMSDVLYAVKSNRANLAMKLESIVRKSDTGVYFYEPFSVSLDAHEMTEGDLTEILNTIIMYLSYDYIIVDLDSSVLWKRDLLMQYANRMLLVGGGSEVSGSKLKKLLQELAIKDEQEESRQLAKVSIVYNQWTKNSRPVSTKNGVSVYGTIEVSSNETPRGVIEEISGRPFFDRLI